MILEGWDGWCDITIMLRYNTSSLLTSSQKIPFLVTCTDGTPLNDTKISTTARISHEQMAYNNNINTV